MWTSLVPTSWVLATPDCYEEKHERQRKARSTQRLRVAHGVAHLRPSVAWPATSASATTCDTIQAVAGLLSHQQGADLTWGSRCDQLAPVTSLYGPLLSVHGLMRCPYLASVLRAVTRICP